jgi:L-cysteine S-thiosulfotransferase
MKLAFSRLSRPQKVGVVVIGAALVGACASVGTSVTPPVTSKEWQTRATAQSQGVVSQVDGKTIQQRYPFGGFGTASFDQWPTFAPTVRRTPPPKKGQMPSGIKGDPKKGHALVKAGAKGPCTACHVIPDVTVWPAGNVGPDLRAIGSRGISDDFLYQIIYDPRVVYGNDTPMAPFGASGMWTPKRRSCTRSPTCSRSRAIRPVSRTR